MYKGKMDINKAKEGHKHKYGTCKYMIINEHAYMILHDLKSQVTSVENYISHLKRDFILVMCSHDGTSNRNFAARKFSKFHQFVPMSAALSTNQGPAVSDPDTVWFLRSFLISWKDQVTLF